MPLPEQLTVLNAKCKSGAQVIQTNSWLVINLMLIGLFALMLFVYVVQMNGITANNYRIKTLTDKISSLNEVNSSLSVSRAVIDDVGIIMEFAKSNNMIKGDGSVALYGDARVAMQR